MSKITISEYDVVFNNRITPVFARVYASNDFVNSDEESVIGGGVQSANYVKQVAVTYANGVATIAAFSGANQIDSTIYGVSGGNLATYALTLHSAKGQLLHIVLDNIRVPEIPNPTTWADLDTYSNARVEPFRHAYYDVDAINALLANTGIASKMSTVIYGTGVLDTVASSVANPTVVGINSNRIRRNLYSDYGGSITAAEAANPTDDVIIEVNQPYVTTSSKTTATNLYFDIVGKGKMTASNCALVISKMVAEPGNNQVFDKVGTGTVTLAAGATSYINLAWFCQKADAGWGWTQATNSVAQSAGARLVVPPGVWVGINSKPLVDGLIIDGSGSYPDAGQATVLKNTANGGSVFTITQGFRNVVIRDVVLDCGTTTGAKCFSGASTSNISAFALTFERVAFHNGEYGSHFTAVGSGGLWEMEQVKYIQCQFVGQTVAGHYNDSVNGTWSFDQCFAATANGSNGFDFNRTGTTTISNTTVQSTDFTGGTCFKFTNAHGTVTISNCQDEGMDYFLSTDVSDYRYPFLLSNNVIQSPIRINGSCVIVSRANGYALSHTYTSAVGAFGLVYSSGDSIEYAQDVNGNPVVPKALADFTGTGSILCTDSISGLYESVERLPKKFLSPLQLDGNATTPVVSVGHATGVAENKILLRLGHTNGDGVFDFYADIYRDIFGGTGKFHVVGNQVGFCNWVWHSDIEVPPETFGVGWSASMEVPTKDDVYDQMILKANLISPSFTTPTLGVASGTSLALGGGTALTTTNRTGTGNLVLADTPTLITPVIGVATGTSLALSGASTAASYTATGLIKSSGTAGIGYATGAGGSVAQGSGSGKATTVVLNKICGEITMDAASLAGDTSVAFTLTNSTIAVGDVMIINHVAGGTIGRYLFNPQCGAGSAVINVHNLSAGALAQAVVISFVVVKAVTS